MSNNSKKPINGAISTQEGSAAAEAKPKDVPETRKRTHFDKNGNLLISRGTYFDPKLYWRYKRLALLRNKNVYELINDAMRAYDHELKSQTMEKLLEAGQETLQIK